MIKVFVLNLTSFTTVLLRHIPQEISGEELFNLKTHKFRSILNNIIKNPGMSYSSLYFGLPNFYEGHLI